MDEISPKFRVMERKEIEVAKIESDPDQPRKEFTEENLRQITENIRRNGILIPLIVMPFGPGKKDRYLLIDGERRWRAAKKIGLKTVPCVIQAKVEGFDLDILRFAIHHQRKDWTPFEKADKLYQMTMTYGKSLPEIARETGVSEQTIRGYLKIRELPVSVREIANQNKDKFKLSYLTEMVGVNKSLDESWRREFPEPEKIISQKIESDLIKSPIELRRLKEVFKKNNPVVIRRFLQDQEYSVEDAYIQSGRASEDFQKDLTNDIKHLVASMEEAFKRDLYQYAERILVEEIKGLIDLLQQFIKLHEEKQEEEIKSQERLRKFREEHPDAI